jgi:hypothetical protein
LRDVFDLPALSDLLQQIADRRIRVRDGRILHEGAPVEPVGSDGRVQLPDEAIAALGDAELEAEVTPDEVRLRRRSETGHA